MEAKSLTELEGSVPRDEGVLPCWQRTAREEVTAHMKNARHMQACTFLHILTHVCMHTQIRSYCYTRIINTHMYTHLVHVSCCPKKLQHSILTAEQH